MSVVAILKLAALVGLGAYAWSHGWLTRERILRAGAVLRGETDTEGDAASVAVVGGEGPKSASDRLQRNAELDERYRIEIDRREREIQDGWRLLEAQQLAFLREREGFEFAKMRSAEEAQKRAQEAANSGVKKELEILSGIKAKEAKELLKQKADADVVRILMSMDSRQARKIVSACKTTEERSWIGRILESLHERDAAQAEALGAGS